MQVILKHRAEFFRMSKKLYKGSSLETFSKAQINYKLENQNKDKWFIKAFSFFFLRQGIAMLSWFALVPLWNPG